MALTDFPDDRAADGAGRLQLRDITAEARRLAAWDGHERIVLGTDTGRGLRAIVAIHDSRLGPALGGTRVWPHPTLEAALTDALRLSRGMTYKAAIAGVPFGGGKAVIMADPARGKTPAMLDAYAEMLAQLQDSYVTAEDVGLTLADADYLKARTPNVVGTTAGGSGNPSPVTAHGVFLGLCAAVRHRLQRGDLSGLRVAVQGLGAVGGALCERLHAAGAELVVADIDPARTRAVATRLGARAADPQTVLSAAVDVAAPCALGAVLSRATIPALRAKVVAGAANNQLAERDDAAALRERGILYAPDFVLNAGGLINVAAELAPGGCDRAAVLERLATIPQVLSEIFRRAERTGRPTNRIAHAMAEERLRAAAPRTARRGA
ncbi:amino acid dehydrogenase [Rhodobacteraceae bacterium 2CG4]|uniref:Amino acid dehydrogenase n=1 Tax=Halovulum marinum TaxID=2662447 RepID=A0A6L5YZI8_9RHOB|nr:Glu/Leu/Phe/Val dehydrogenase dimerization domain-containing protein [Halovulum marinum]MSU89275.1 amino acid dehydrogenase [Halovulum marinum]